MKRSLALVFFFAISSVTPANAIMGGTDATGDPRVVALIPWTENFQRGCSGALITPRIVLTAAHCLSRMPKSGIWRPDTNTELPVYGPLSPKTPLWVASPGIIIPTGGTSDKVKVIAQFGSSLYQDAACDSQNKSCHGSRYDFGVLVLEKPLGQQSYRIATSTEVQNLISFGSEATAIGYGLTSYEESLGAPRNQNPNLAKVQVRNQFVWQGGDELVMPFFNNMIVQTRWPLNVYGGGGDSGSPLWATINGEEVYVGALSAATGATAATKPGDPLFTDPFWGTNGTSGPGGQYFTAQAFQSVIDEATNFLKMQIEIEQAAAEAKAAEAKARSKKVITCTKGKLIKKISSANPKCPPGYKRKI